MHNTRLEQTPFALAYSLQPKEGQHTWRASSLPLARAGTLPAELPVTATAEVTGSRVLNWATPKCFNPRRVNLSCFYTRLSSTSMSSPESAIQQKHLPRTHESLQTDFAETKEVFMQTHFRSFMQVQVAKCNKLPKGKEREGSAVRQRHSVLGM